MNGLVAGQYSEDGVGAFMKTWRDILTRFAKSESMVVRLQKFLADAGVASRRASEQIITAGRVSVNGESVWELGSKVDPVHDHVAVDGWPVKEKRKLYIALNKPCSYLCSRTDPDGRRVIGQLLPKEWFNLYTVGRLDYNSEG